jgi:hypothetical protein
VVLRTLPGNTGGATAVYDMPDAQPSPAVESITLDDIFARSLAPGQRCRLLKIDCEGVEYEFLPSPLLGRVDFLAGEFHEDVFHGRPRALEAACARYIPPERMRIHCCLKQD